MATHDDVRRIALSLPEATEDPDGFRFSVGGKQFVWAWLLRMDPKRARVPSKTVIAARDLLAVVVTDAWRLRAPKRLLHVLTPRT